MEIYAVLDLHKPPQKLKWSKGQSNYFHYFSPPLPSIVVLFAVDTDRGKSEQGEFAVKLTIDNTIEERTIGHIGRTNSCLYWKEDWTNEEKCGAEAVEELGRLLKISVCTLDSNDDEGFHSQGAAVLSKDETNDFTFDDEEICEFERSLVELEEECKENQASIKRLNKKIVGDKQQKKVSDFFKCKPTVKGILEEQTRKINHEKKPKVLEIESADDTNNNNTLSRKGGRKRISSVDRTSEKSKKLCTSKLSRSNTKAASALKFSDFMCNEKPSHRWGHVFCKLCDSKAILIGGQGFRHQMNADSLWTLDIETKEWTPQQSDNPSVDRRMGHTGVYDEKKQLIYVFGGSKHKKWYNDIYTLDVDTWKWNQIKTIGKAPTRAYHSCTKFYDELLVFGGVYPNPDPQPDGCSDELVIFDTEKNSWYNPIVNGEIPDARSGHSACILESKLYVFGGWDSPQCFNDLYSLDIVIMNFMKLEPIGKEPSPRTWHSTTVLRDGRSFCIYGGYNGRESLNDVFVYNSVNDTWSEISKRCMSIRAGHKAISYAEEDGDGEEKERILVFGGGDNNGEFYDDICTLQP